MARRLVEVTREAMWRGIRAVRPGATLGDIGHAIQSFAEAERFSVVREYCGHGIGRSTTKIRRCCTTASPVPACAQAGHDLHHRADDQRRQARHTRLMPDGWTVVTKDRKLSAQWEHTIVVTQGGYDVLTRLPGDDNWP
ncbi:MAG: M24 family metallopeptidase [Chiayiivirga sp.]|jgi:methionyl aminopeptidase|nr:M24 family metallopeptidase [Chiayiivirga sp.]